MPSRAGTLAGVALVLVSAAALRCGSSPVAPPSPSPTCSYTIASQTLSFGASGGTGTVSITTTAGCSWSASADGTWIAFPGGSSGAGSASLSFSVGANAAVTTREANISVAGQTVRVSQGAAAPVVCDYAVSPESQRFGASGGNRSIAITTGAACAWTAVSTESWLAIAVPASGTGNGTINYTVAPWTGTTERSGLVRVGGREVTIRQDPPVPVNCEYSVSPTSFTMHWHETTHDIQVQTGNGCTWTVESGGSWLAIPGGRDRSGPGTVTFTTEQYTGEPNRSAPVMIRWPTASQGQNVWVTHEGCRYAIAATSRTFTAAGGSDHVTVFRDPVSTGCGIGCPVTPQVSHSWIRVTSVALGIVSDLEMYFQVDANTTGADRTGTITVADRVLTITQSR